MFNNSTSTLRGCLRHNSAIYGRCRCRFDARFHDSSKSTLSKWAPLHPDSCVAKKSAGSYEQPYAGSSAHTTTYDQSQCSESSFPTRRAAPSPVESRVQSVRPSPAKHQSRNRARRLESAMSLSNHIFGRKDRPGLSKRLVARKGPGPEPVSVLQPDGSGTKGSNIWSFAPAWKSIAVGSEDVENTDAQSEMDEYAAFCSVWRTKYLQLYSHSRAGDSVKIRQDFEVHRQVAEAFVGDRSLEELWKVWAEMPLRSRLRHLAPILLGCLTDSARKTLLMLSLNFSFPRDWRTRCECLSYLDFLYRKEIDADPYLQELFAKQIERVSRLWTWPSESMPWHFLVLLLRHNNPEHCENIIDTVFQNYDPVPPRLILIMVDHFTKLGNADRAIGLLSRIPPEQREEHKVRILERCANLISIDIIEKSDSVGNFRALPKLIGLGLPMDSKVHNRIIERAIALGMPQVAWEVFRFMEAKNIPVNAGSHLFLLKDSFERNSREKLDAMMSAIHGREDLYQYPYLVTYMMHIVRVVCAIDRKLSSETSVSHLLAIYDRAYDRAPLVKLGIVNALPVEQSLLKQLEQPPPAVLGFTIWAYVLCQRDERLVSALWFWIIHMVKQQDESILACAKYDIMYNGFIHFYARSRFFLRKAVDVVEGMIEHNLCMPTERTWSEVLCGFLKHGEEETAEKIWRMMLARNVQPTEKGWAFLLEKYDETQLAELVRYVLDERRMPEGVDTALGWQTVDTAKRIAETEELETQQAIAEDDEDIENNGTLAGDGLGGTHADPALVGA